MSVALKPEGLRMEKGLLKSLTQTISFLRREIVLASSITIFLLECASNTFKSKSDHPSGRSTDQNPGEVCYVNIRHKCYNKQTREGKNTG